MDVINTPVIVGAALFFGGAALATLVSLYYLRKTRQLLTQFSPVDYDVRWSRVVWLYLVLFFVTVSLGYFYLLQYFQKSLIFWPRVDDTLSMWPRWLTVGVEGALLLATLACRTGGSAGDTTDMEMARGWPQSFFSVFLYLVSLALLAGADWAQDEGARLTLVVPSICWFVAALALLFFPEDKLWGRDYERVRQILFSERATWSRLWAPRRLEEREAAILFWAFVYRLVLFVSLALSFLAWLITWFLSELNGFSSVASLQTTVIAYLCGDALLVVPFLLLFAYLTLTNTTQHVTKTDRDTTQFSMNTTKEDVLLHAALAREAS